MHESRGVTRAARGKIGGQRTVFHSGICACSDIRVRGCRCRLEGAHANAATPGLVRAALMADRLLPDFDDHSSKELSWAPEIFETFRESRSWPIFVWLHRHIRAEH